MAMTSFHPMQGTKMGRSVMVVDNPQSSRS